MELRTIYATWCGIVGAMVGAVLAALVMLMFAIFALLGNGLSGPVKILGYALMVIMAVLPIAVGAYIGIRWAKKIEKNPEANLQVEKGKAYIFLGFSILVAILLVIVSIIRIR